MKKLFILIILITASTSIVLNANAKKKTVVKKEPEKIHFTKVDDWSNIKNQAKLRYYDRLYNVSK
jgi:hypothetical protein